MERGTRRNHCSTLPVAHTCRRSSGAWLESGQHPAILLLKLAALGVSFGTMPAEALEAGASPFQSY